MIFDGIHEVDHIGLNGATRGPMHGSQHHTSIDDDSSYRALGEEDVFLDLVGCIIVFVSAYASFLGSTFLIRLNLVCHQLISLSVLSQLGRVELKWPYLALLLPTCRTMNHF